MSLIKQLAILSISAAALGYTLMPTVQAAVYSGPSGLEAQSSIVQIQAKPKGKATCGTYMYWSAKDKKCMDARLKKQKE